ncbi:LCP family protein [Bacillus cytotoxicus]|uniref:Cell envelope-related transcriptional attenuator n=1 Tax=Bacillus cytotoxicus (strain DSM 22905 / CIP 110041 / 391-98 / NVH 391-98) TaxID=315749 RepID=A7GNV6_BACCN|nr:MULTISPECIES: LCP family protein [Bacillus cereus group]ABS21814.1 cell envelope-related transcriptional attenuator [Bacillus cytotoxicus NVH 391-98]AWC28423.1 LytR family transcriptional regulator [Bacillus cytotoxicus]AWC32451.1 LytR family transcriptional regulator [Bacillus cytotoxicus]AWC36481.1 LytR family transcriptional regulator [Bacillus cytotoxicus]AWC40192.1 LytR family transcriptional regulator [Bacillus cytotoxicus]
MSSELEHHNTRSKQRRFKRKSFKWIIFISLFLLLLGGIGYGSVIYNKAKAVANKAYEQIDKSTKRDKEVEPLKDNVSILIMGVDGSDVRESQYGEAVRTDALLLATINKDNKTVKLVSIPRDSRVYIPSRKKLDKIAHAHVFGGVESTRDTVERFLDVPVDYYVKFNFDSFMRIVDSLGGIDVDVPVTFTEQDSKDQAGMIHLEKGYQHLNGEQALALARTRKIDSDAMRGQRQQLVIEAIAKKAFSAQSISKMSSLLTAIDNGMKTNLTFDDMLSIAKNMAESDWQMDKIQVEGTDKRIRGIYYYMPNEKNVKEISKTLNEHLGIASN